MVRAKGIDVSRWQESSVKWYVAAKLDGVSFAFIRASGGIRGDWWFPVQYIRAGMAGILRGAYHYLYADPSIAEQASVFSTMTRGLRLELPCILDVEQEGLTLDHVRRFICTWHGYDGRPLGIYTSASRWAAICGPGQEWGKSHPLWVAHWKAEEPRLPDVWQRWEFWQVTDNALLQCYSGRLDMNYYNGTEEELRAKYG